MPIDDVNRPEVLPPESESLAMALREEVPDKISPVVEPPDENEQLQSKCIDLVHIYFEFHDGSSGTSDDDLRVA